MSDVPTIAEAQAAVRASGRGHRNSSDLYTTPPEAGSALADLVRTRLTLPPAPKVLEPTAGDGRLLLQIVEEAPDALDAAHLTVVELSGIWMTDLQAYDECACPMDFLAWARVNRARQFDLILGNPPYGLSFAVVRAAYELLAPGGYLALLLRHGFLESGTRWTWHRDHPLTGMRTLHARQHFRLNAAGKRGTDKWSSAWMVWQRPRAHGGQDLQWMDTW